MRIAFILTSLAVGGAERQTLWLAARLASRGHAVKLLILRPRPASNPAAWDWGDDGGKEAQSDPAAPQPDPFPGTFPVTFLGINKTPWSVLRGLRQAAGELRRFRPDILHGHNFHGNIAARILGFCGTKIPVTSTIQNVYEGGGGVC
jgi:hypothetical protein